MAMTEERILLSIVEAAEIVGVGRTTMYAYIGAGELEVTHVGRLAKIHREALEDFIRRLREGAVPSPTKRAPGTDEAERTPPARTRARRARPAPTGR
jgi:excisionase family DNA binding protein